MVIKKEDKLRKDFYTFQSKVNKLEEIKNELKELDTRSFEKEVSIIKSRIKDTTAIPELDRLMKNLRNKILNKKPVKKKSRLKKLEKNFEEITDTNIEIKKEIKDLKSSISGEMNKHLKEDSDVGLVVDKGLQDFIGEVKLELSNKVRNKERLLNEDLKRDLFVRKRELDGKYKQLTEKLKEDYKNKEKTELHMKVEQKFAEELRKKFEAEKIRLDYLYVSKIKQKYKEDFDKEKKILEDELNSKLRSEMRKTELIRENQKGQTEKEVQNKIIEFNKMKHQLTTEAHERLSKELEIKRKKLDTDLRRDFLIKMNDFVNQQKQKQAEIIEQQTKQFKDVLDHEKKLNNLLEQNLSEKTYEIETLKNKNKQVIANQSKLRREEAIKRLNEHQHLIDEHKSEVHEITNNLKNDLQNKYKKQLKNQINEEKERLQLKFSRKKKDIIGKIHDSSIKEREEIKAKLEGEYQESLRMAISKMQEKLKHQIKEEFTNNANEKILEEKNKLLGKIKELEKKYKHREWELKQKERNLIMKEKDKNLNIASEKSNLLKKMNIIKNENEKIKSERVQLQKEFAERAHNQIIDELKHREIILKDRMQKHFDERMRRHEIELENDLLLKTSQLDKEFSKKASDLKEQFDKEKRLNQILNKAISGKDYSIDKQIEKNKLLVAQLTAVKHMESRKRVEEHKYLIEKHKKDVEELTERLKNQMHNRCDLEIKKHISDEKERLQKNYEDRKRELSSKLSITAFRERADLRKRLKAEYNRLLKKSIKEKQDRLHEQLRKEFKIRANEQIIGERKKLNDKIVDMENKFNVRETELKLRERNIMNSERERDLILASEKKKFTNKIALFKKSESIKMKDERIKIQKMSAEKAHQQMLEEMKEKQQLIKDKLQKQFEEKLKDTLRLQEIGLSKKKAELAHELENKAKALLR